MARVHHFLYTGQQRLARDRLGEVQGTGSLFIERDRFVRGDETHKKHWPKSVYK